MWNLKDIQTALGKHFHNAQSQFIASIVIDTRILKENDLFVALKGEQTDGHHFIQQAEKKGAKALILQQKPAHPTSLPYVIVDDCRAALLKLARFRRKQFTGKMIAITGSVGKTTTKDLTHLCLNSFGRSYAAQKSFNNQLGISLTLANLPLESDFCVCEVGMNHKGEIQPLGELIAPDVAMITTIGRAHIGYMGSVEAIAHEKLTLLQTLDQGGQALVPQELQGNDYLATIARQKDLQIWFCGSTPNAQIAFEATQTVPAGLNVKARILNTTIHYDFPVKAPHLAYDGLLALGICQALGCSPQKAAMQLMHFKAAPGRGKRYVLKHSNITILDESYNASPQSMSAALAWLSIQPARRRIAVLGDMGELGQFSDSEHRKLATTMPATIQAIFACGPHMKQFAAIAGEKKEVFWRENAREIQQALIDYIQPGDVILIKASRFMHMEALLTTLLEEDSHLKHAL